MLQLMQLDKDSIVSNIIEKYVLPPYPLYRVIFVNTWIDYNSVELESRVYSRIMECKPINGKIDLTPEGQFISPSTIQDLEQNKIITDVVSSDERYIIIDAKKLC